MLVTETQYGLNLAFSTMMKRIYELHSLIFRRLLLELGFFFFLDSSFSPKIKILEMLETLEKQRLQRLSVDTIAF